MKFHQLINGQIFHYQDKFYTKVSPVLAVCNETGTQKFMRRADHVDVQENASVKPGKAGNGLINKSVVLQLIDQALGTTHSQIEGTAIDESSKIVFEDLITQLRIQLTNKIEALSVAPVGIKSRKNR